MSHGHHQSVQEFVPEINFGLEDGEPIPLVQYDDQSTEFILNSDAIEVINQHQGNIGLVSIFGKHRTGKSFLLNKVLGCAPRTGVILSLLEIKMPLC